MKKTGSVAVALTAVSLLLATVGCFETATLLSVRKDGSGMVIVREYFSPQISQMMEGIPAGEAQEPEAGADGKPAPTPKPKQDSAPASIEMFKDQIEKRTARLGEGVTLAESKPIVNEAGWRGYQAKYAFRDVTKLRLKMGDTDMGGAGEGSGGGAENKSGTEYTFEFAPGGTATLKIIPATKDKPASAAETSAEEKKPDEDVAAFGEIQKIDESGAEEANPLAAGMSGMLGSMFQGMRLTFLVQVEGAITETDSSYKSENAPNIVTVMDMPVDKMLSNQAAMNLLMAKDPNAAEKLAKMNIEGLKLADAERAITVKFK